MTIEQLQKENENLRLTIIEKDADLLIIKNTVEQILKTFGVINEDGTPKENISVKAIVGEVTSMLTGALMPKMPWEKEKPSLEEKFSFIQNIMPIYQKYKHL